LADLVRDLSSRLADQTALTAIWQERARVLGDQLALMPPQATIAGQPAPEVAPASSEGSAPWWRSWWSWLMLFVVIAAVVLAVMATGVVR